MKLVSLGLALGAGLLLVVVLSYESHPTARFPDFPDTRAATDRRTEMLERRVLALEERIAALRVEMATMQARVSEGRRESIAATEAATAGSRQVVPDPRADEEREERMRAALLETAFSRESTERAWSHQATGAVRDALSRAELQAIPVRAIECRSRTCRVEVGDGAGAAAELLQQLVQEVGTALPSSASSQTVNADGSTTAVLYLYRDLAMSAR